MDALTYRETPSRHRLSAVGAALLSAAVLLALVGRKPSPSQLASSPSAPRLPALAAASFHPVNSREAFGFLANRSWAVHCDNVSFAYCAFATCRVNNDSHTASCGCESQIATSGQILFSATNPWFVESPVFLRALTLVARHGDDGGATDVICDAVRKKTFWRSAGFDTDYGSFASSASSSWRETNSSCSRDRAYNFAGCMGGPCNLSLPFNGDYNATCVCPYRNATPATTSNDGENTDEGIITPLATYADCAEIKAGGGGCATQDSSLIMAHSYAQLRTYLDAMRVANYTTAGAQCPTAWQNSSLVVMPVR